MAPNPTSTYGGTLDGVTVGPAGSAWATGGSGVADNPDSGGQTVIARGEGSVWAVLPSPSPGGNNGDGVLSGVASTVSGGAWAVGSYFDAGGDPQNLIECWNGTTWTR